MAATSDTFFDFVDWLEAHLDDHEMTGSEVAADNFVSRHHFDRVIRAAAGEPPGRFRRRVLLERAAYRLSASEAGILSIAIEAGYSSNEAFTRAFRRAFGQTPTQWTSDPHTFRLPSPNDVHFHPPGGLRLPPRREDKSVNEKDLVVRMVEHHIWLIGELLERARRLDEAGQTFLDEVRRVTEEDRLDETFVDTLCEPAEVFSYGGMIAHVLTFAAHRRLLVLGALTSAGITDLGAGDPAQWVMDGS